MPDAAIGFDVGGQSVKAVLVDDTGTVLADCSRPTGKQASAKSLGAAVAAAYAELSRILSSVPTLGVGIAGVMGADGALRGSPNLPCLLGVHVADFLAHALDAEVTVDNDANCAALAEGWTGAAEGEKNFLLVTLGSGIGSGLILEHKVFHGSTGHGCELGHAVIVKGGRRCGCGNLGCLEAYVSEVAAHELVDEAGGELLVEVSSGVARGAGFAQSIFELARKGSVPAERIAGGMIEALGVGLASAVNMFDVTTIIVGGGIAPSVMARYEGLKRSIASSLFARSIDSLTIRAAAHGSLAGAIGAARMAKLRR